MANSARVAAKDCVLDGGDGREYLIKKGGIVMIPRRVQHRTREVWGDDVDVFDQLDRDIEVELRPRRETTGRK